MLLQREPSAVHKLNRYIDSTKRERDATIWLQFKCVMLVVLCLPTHKSLKSIVQRKIGDLSNNSIHIKGSQEFYQYAHTLTNNRENCDANETRIIQKTKKWIVEKKKKHKETISNSYVQQTTTTYETMYIWKKYKHIFITNETNVTKKHL